MLLFISGLILGVVLCYKLVKRASYWTGRSVTYEPGAWPIVGNMKDFVIRKRNILQISGDLYKKYPDERYVGYMQFSTPALLIRDLDLIKQVGVKQFDHFHDHAARAHKSVDPILSKSLVHLHGEKWKQMRATLSPAFTSSKMRNLHGLMVECSANFVGHFDGRGAADVEMKDLVSRFAKNVIASTAFGVEVDCVENPDDGFNTMSNRLTKFGVLKTLKFFLLQSKRLVKLLNIRLLDEDIADFFRSIVVDNIREREKNDIVRPDLIHLLMEARKGRLRHEDAHDEREGFATVEESHIGKDSEQMELTDDHIVAQALVFFFAGFETVSTASAFVAYELAVNPDVQQKLQEEIDEVRKRHEGKVPYEALSSMKYLDQVVSETLRKWPPAPQTDRYCRKDYTIAPTDPQEKTFVIEKGVTAIIPIMGLHHDPLYFPDPEKFDPERFNDENKGKIIPGSYLPFGIGPRNCIGSRFALLEMKTLFFHLLSKYDLAPNEKTQIPLVINPRSVNLSPKNGFQLTLKPREMN